MSNDTNIVYWEPWNLESTSKPTFQIRCCQVNSLTASSESKPVLVTGPCDLLNPDVQLDVFIDSSIRDSVSDEGGYSAHFITR